MWRGSCANGRGPGRPSAESIASLDHEYVIGLKAVNCQSGEPLVQEQVTAESKEKVLNAVGNAAAKLRGELGENISTVKKLDVPLEQATTSSLEALQAYSEAEKAFAAKGTEAALPYHQRAIQLDPNFAMGYELVGNDYGNLGELARSSEYLTKAFALREHASERERLIISANYYTGVTGDLNKAGETYQELLTDYPRDGRMLNDAALVYASLGEYDKAVPMLRQAQGSFRILWAARQHSQLSDSPGAVRCRAANPSAGGQPWAGRLPAAQRSLRSCVPEERRGGNDGAGAMVHSASECCEFWAVAGVGH